MCLSVTYRVPRKVICTAPTNESQHHIIGVFELGFRCLHLLIVRMTAHLSSPGKGVVGASIGLGQHAVEALHQFLLKWQSKQAFKLSPSLQSNAMLYSFSPC